MCVSECAHVCVSDCMSVCVFVSVQECVCVCMCWKHMIADPFLTKAFVLLV